MTSNKPWKPFTEFVTDIPSVNPQSVWNPVAIALKDRPGEWARILDREDSRLARNHAAALRHKGQLRKTKGFEVVSRGVSIYARYIGGGEDE